MRALIFTILIISLVACFGPKTMDSSSKEAIQKSITEIGQSLDQEQKHKFTKAVMFFTMRGVNLFKTPSSSTKDNMVSNFAIIDGLTGEQIISKYIELETSDRLEKDKVEKLTSEAIKMLDSKQFIKAIDKYGELAKIESGVEEATKGIAETQLKMKAFEEMISYIDKVKITEFTAERIDTYSGKDTPAVRISLKNNGDRSLSRVTVMVYFQDKTGNTIYEEDFTPVVVSKYSMTNNKPLKPGYVREMEKGKYYTIKSPLSEWDEGKATIKITEIEFLEN